jgi:hypothetical protein
MTNPNEREGTGFQTIGSLAESAAQSAKARSIPPLRTPDSSPVSETTGTPRRELAPPKPTGIGLTKTGSAQDWLIGMWTNGASPQEVEAAVIAGLPSALGSRLKETFTRDYELEGYTLEGAPMAEKEIARRLVEASLTASGRPVVLGALAKLGAKTRIKGGDQGTKIEAYAEEMVNYPIDAVVWACKRCAEASPWFPSWHELRERLEFATERRRALMRAL